MPGRNSYILKVGRFYQEVSMPLRFFDAVFRKVLVRQETKDAPLIVLLAPPRSGSTLTYQLLTSGFENFHLTNIWNLLYATPTIGALISEQLAKNKGVSSFESHQGYVPGLTGEAEGLKFWSYWTGQTLEQRDSGIDHGKFESFKESVSILAHRFRKPMITGYLGHVFCIKELEQHFPQVLFVHLYRDLVSNAYSIYRIAPTGWLSTRPDFVSDDIENRHHEIVRQLVSIHKTILGGLESNFVSVSYRQITSDPRTSLRSIQQAAEKVGISLKLKNLDAIPSAFRHKEYPDDTHARLFRKYAAQEVASVEEKHGAFIQQLLR